MGSWMGSALNRAAEGGSAVAVGSGIGHRMAWVGILTLTSLLTSCATCGKSSGLSKLRFSN